MLRATQDLWAATRMPRVGAAVLGPSGGRLWCRRGTRFYEPVADRVHADRAHPGDQSPAGPGQGIDLCGGLGRSSTGCWPACRAEVPVVIAGPSLEDVGWRWGGRDRPGRSHGRRQLLCAAYRTDALRAALAAQLEPVAGLPVSSPSAGA